MTTKYVRRARKSPEDYVCFLKSPEPENLHTTLVGNDNGATMRKSAPENIPILRVFLLRVFLALPPVLLSPTPTPWFVIATPHFSVHKKRTNTVFLGWWAVILCCQVILVVLELPNSRSKSTTPPIFEKLP